MAVARAGLLLANRRKFVQMATGAHTVWPKFGPRVFGDLVATTFPRGLIMSKCARIVWGLPFAARSLPALGNGGRAMYWLPAAEFMGSSRSLFIGEDICVDRAISSWGCCQALRASSLVDAARDRDRFRVCRRRLPSLSTSAGVVALACLSFVPSTSGDNGAYDAGRRVSPFSRVHQLASVTVGDAG